MSNSKSKKSSKPKADDIEKIQSDVASFASSLGLASSLPSYGFNDTDFRPQKKKLPQNNSSKKPISQHPQSQKPNSKFSPKTQKKDGFNPKFDNNNNSNRPFDKSRNAHNSQFQKPNSNFRPKSSTNDGLNSNIENSNRSFDKYRKMPKLPLVKASALGTWYEDLSEVEGKLLGSGGERKRVNFGNIEEWKKMVEKKKELGERLLAQYTFDYESSRGQTGDIKMLMATQKSGTAVDKASAYSVSVGDNPIANMRSLDALLAMVTSKVGKRHALVAFENLKLLFTDSLLPDRKLKTLFHQPLNHLPETKDGYSLLLFWYWEECLKSRYERFVIALEEASRDVLAALKDKALKIMSALLKSKSEQERRLLTALVNKLGDPDKKAASSADYSLKGLLSDHPNMRAVVIDEVDTFLFRPHLAMHAKFHAINFLSQTRLSHNGDGPKVARRLVDIYFALFKVLISGAGTGLNEEKSPEIKKSSTKDNKDMSESHVELDSRLLSALLTGVNRAFPYVSGDEADEIIDIQTPVLFRLVHSQNFNVGIQALMLLDKISSKNQVVSDRFYRALYAKLLLPAVLNTSKAEMFFGLLLRAMKNDINSKRVAAFAKRILQVALQQPPQYACGCLFLLSEVLKTRPPLWNRAIQNEAADDDLEHFEDAPDETEDQPDHDAPDEMEDQPGDDGIIPQSNIGEISGSSRLNSDSDSSEDDEVNSANSEEDISDDDGNLVMRENIEKPQDPSSAKIDGNEGNKLESPTGHSLPGGYDPRHREPSFCNADHAGWWELTVLASHTHPSVSTMARTLLSGATIVYNGNPLNDLSLAAFLDKFMEKKPKQSAWHGGSDIEPAKKIHMNKHLVGSEILSLAEDDVPPEDLVFHKFYMNKMGSTKKLKKKKKGAADEEAADLYGGDDDSANEEIDVMLDGNEAKLDTDGGYDSDDLEKIVNEDDDDLVGDVSDNEMEMDAFSDEGEEATEVDTPDLGADESDDDDIKISDADDVSDDDDIKIGDMDDGSDDEEDELPVSKKGKKKSGGKKSSASPFASIEEYEHLLSGDISDDENTVEDPESKPQPRKKRKHSRKGEGSGKDEMVDNSRKRKRNNKRTKTLK